MPPMLDGIAPVRLLLSRPLRAQSAVEMLSAPSMSVKQNPPIQHSQIIEDELNGGWAVEQASHSRRDGAAELVVTERTAQGSPNGGVSPVLTCLQ